MCNYSRQVPLSDRVEYYIYFFPSLVSPLFFPTSHYGHRECRHRLLTSISTMLEPAHWHLTLATVHSKKAPPPYLFHRLWRKKAKSCRREVGAIYLRNCESRECVRARVTRRNRSEKGWKCPALFGSTTRTCWAVWASKQASKARSHREGGDGVHCRADGGGQELDRGEREREFGIENKVVARSQRHGLLYKRGWESVR